MMGAGWSTENQEILDEIDRGLNKAESETTISSSGIRLFRLEISNGRHEWRLVSSFAFPKFYDENEDRPSMPHRWHLEVEAGNVDVPISHGLDMRGDQDERRVTFLGAVCWSLKFPNAESYKAFWNDYRDKLFENTFGVKNTPVNRQTQLGKDYADRLYTECEDEDMMDFYEDAEEEVDYRPPKRENVRSTGDGDSEVSLLRVGIGENSYVVRGKKIERLHNLDEGVSDAELKFNVRTPDGTAVKPSSLMLANRETKMGVLTPDNPGSLMYADIETGTVVNEWKFMKDKVEVPMMDIVPETKAAPNEERSTFLSFDKDRICRWDMRDPSGIVQQMETPVLDYLSGKDYAKYTNFTCMATTGDGSVVVGSRDGRVRLYSNKLTLKRASTAFPPMGTPITHIDVTFDGNWVVATTDHFIEVLKTTATNEDGKVINGFQKSLSSHAYQPKLLKLRPEDMIKTAKAPLKKARFAFVTEAGHRERYVVASCGRNVVVWNFQQVKTSRTSIRTEGGLQTNTSYRMCPMDENVLDSSFMHESHGRAIGGMPESAIVVATPKKVWSRWD